MQQSSYESVTKFTSTLVLSALIGVASGSTGFIFYLLWDNTKRITALETATAGYIARNETQHQYMIKSIDDMQSDIKTLVRNRVQ